MSRVLILGGGYVGGVLADVLPDSCVSHSSPEKAAVRGGLYFRLDDRNSWANLPAADCIVWTFPAAPLEQVRAFHAACLQNSRLLVVYGSTSCYLTHTNDEHVTEAHPLDLSQVRVQGEEYLRQHGALVLVLSGIYGPGRDPLNWLRSGRIHSWQKRVNLIHRDDIVAITTHLLRNSGFAGERINLSDGHSRRWSDIAAQQGIVQRSDSNTPAPATRPRISKRISNARLRQVLPEGFRFRQLY